MVPKIPRLGLVCPFALLRGWAADWDRRWGGRSEPPPLFCTVGSGEARAVRYDQVRKLLQGVFGVEGVGTHSLRKGGAAWMRFDLKLDEEVVQSQGGWASRECMQQAYTVLSQDLRRKRILDEVAARYPGTGGAGVPLDTLAGSLRRGRKPSREKTWPRYPLLVFY